MPKSPEIGVESRDSYAGRGQRLVAFALSIRLEKKQWTDTIENQPSRDGAATAEVGFLSTLGEPQPIVGRNEYAQLPPSIHLEA